MVYEAPTPEQLSDGSEDRYPWMVDRYKLASAILGLCADAMNDGKMDMSDVAITLEAIVNPGLDEIKNKKAIRK